MCLRKWKKRTIDTYLDHVTSQIGKSTKYERLFRLLLRGPPKFNIGDYVQEYRTWNGQPHNFRNRAQQERNVWELLGLAILKKASDIGNYPFDLIGFRANRGKLAPLNHVILLEVVPITVIQDKGVLMRLVKGDYYGSGPGYQTVFFNSIFYMDAHPKSVPKWGQMAEEWRILTPEEVEQVKRERTQDGLKTS